MLHIGPDGFWCGRIGVGEQFDDLIEGVLAVGQPPDVAGRRVEDHDPLGARVVEAHVVVDLGFDDVRGRWPHPDTPGHECMLSGLYVD